MYMRGNKVPDNTDDIDVCQSSYFAYLNEINQYKVLTVDEEISLFQKIEAGDDVAKDLFIKSNLKLVVKEAKKYHVPGYNDLLDLIQEGNLGLIQAVENFDLSKGCKFSTYAVYVINKAIQRTPSRSGLPVEIPPHKLALINKMRHTIFSFKSDRDRNPSVEELSGILNVPIDKIVALMPFLSSNISLHRKLGDNGSDKEIIDVFEDYYQEESTDAENVFIAKEARTELRKLLSEFLNKKEIYILYSRWGLANFPVKDVATLASELNMSKQGIRQCEERALAKLRKHFLSLNKSLSDFL